MLRAVELRTKGAIGVFCACLIGAVLAPVAQNWKAQPEDDFPFSYYPMFSWRLGETYEVTHVVGVDADGNEHVVPFRYLGRGGFNQVRVSVQRAAHDDARGFCKRVAAALEAEPIAELRGVRKLVVRTGAYVLDAFYAGRIELQSKREHARCRVAL